MEGANVNAIRFVLFAALLGACAVTDLRSRRIPDALTLGGTVVLVALSFLVSIRSGLLSLGSAAAGFLVFLAVRALTRGKLGGGDAKLSMVIGAALGILGWYIALCVSVSGAIVYALVTGRRRRAITFAPFLAAGSCVGALALALFPSLPLRPF